MPLCLYFITDIIAYNIYVDYIAIFMSSISSLFKRWCSPHSYNPQESYAPCKKAIPSFSSGIKMIGSYHKLGIWEWTNTYFLYVSLSPLNSPTKGLSMNTLILKNTSCNALASSSLCSGQFSPFMNHQRKPFLINLTILFFKE
jgi:hypothetical protein